MLLTDQQRATVLAALEYKKQDRFMGGPTMGELAALDDAIAAVNAMAVYERVPNGRYKFSGCTDLDEDCDCHTIWNIGDDGLMIIDVAEDAVNVEWPAGWALVRTREGVGDGEA